MTTTVCGEKYPGDYAEALYCWLAAGHDGMHQGLSQGVYLAWEQGLTREQGLAQEQADLFDKEYGR